MARRAFYAKLESLDKIRDDQGQGYGDRLLSLVMLNVLDEKWKDHLYDLDQLRNAIHYRSWGQKDPLIEYKQEAYTMFVDLMNDIYNTFADRFLKVQLQFGPPPEPSGDGAVRPRGTKPPKPPTKRYNALGILFIFVMGLIFGWLRQRSGSTLLPMALHAINNVWATVFVAIQVEWLS